MSDNKKKVHNEEISEMLDVLYYEAVQTRMISSVNVMTIKNYIIDLERQIFGLKQSIRNRDLTIDKLKKGYGR